MFGRREKKSILESVRDSVFPAGGWRRAALYTLYRLRRIPDSPNRIAKGVFAGTMVAFTPLFGLHFLIAPAIAFVIRGNLLASLLSVLVCNPITFPFIATGSVAIGRWIQGYETSLEETKLDYVVFQVGIKQVWMNLKAPFTDQVANWTPIMEFFHGVFVPYLTGGTLLGFIAGLLGAWLCAQAVGIYQRRRRDKLQKRGK